MVHFRGACLCSRTTPGALENLQRKNVFDLHEMNMQVGMLHIREKPCLDSEVRQKATRTWAIYMSWIQNTNCPLVVLPPWSQAFLKT